jgi:hypothetical protein
MLTIVIVADWSKFRATSINDKADMNNATLDLEATLDHPPEVLPTRAKPAGAWTGACGAPRKIGQ